MKNHPVKISKKMISKQEVQHIAKLARIGLTQTEIEKFQKELSSILDYFEKLKEINVSKVKPMSYSVLLENVMREDQKKPKNKDKKPKRLLEMAPETKNGYLKVKSIL